MNQTWLASIAVALVVGLSACNDGGDGGVAGGAFGPGTSGAPAYDYFVEGNRLMAVNRMDAGQSPFVVTELSQPGIFSANRWIFTVRDPDNRSGIDYRNAAILFINNDALYRLDVSGPYAGKPQRVSSLLWSEHCWSLDPEELVSQLDQAQIKLLVKGEDDRCSTTGDVYRVVKLGMGANEAPQPISQQQFYSKEIRNTQGGVVGYLSWETKNITVYDSQFGNPRVLINGIGGSVDHAWVFAKGVAGRYDLVEAELNNNTSAVLALDTQTGDARVLARVPSLGSLDWGVHDSWVYFTSGPNKLVRMRLDGASGVEDVLSFRGRLLGIDSGRVVVDEGAGSSSGAIRSYELTNPLKSVFIKTRVLVDGVPIVAGGRVYYSIKPETANQSPAAVSVGITGTDEVVYPNAKWIGSAARNGAYSDTNRYRYWSGVSRVYLGSQMSRDEQGKWHTGVIEAVDATSGRVMAALGKPPVDVPLINIRSVDDSGVALGYGSPTESGGAGAYHYWVLDSRTGTIRQVGTTTTKSSDPYGGRYNWGWWTDWFGFH